MNKRNIVMVGMPASGKSTVGILVAKELGYEFIDTDLLIQKKTGELLHKIIKNRGNAEFRRLENEILSGICVEGTVIATGGSAVYGEDAMENLRKNALVVYIYLPCREIKKRLGDFSHRGVSMEAGQSIEELYNERTPLYERYADITVFGDEHSISVTVERAVEAIKSCFDHGV